VEQKGTHGTVSTKTLQNPNRINDIRDIRAGFGVLIFSLATVSLYLSGKWTGNSVAVEISKVTIIFCLGFMISTAFHKEPYTNLFTIALGLVSFGFLCCIIALT
jgi:hypothetical protein